MSDKPNSIMFDMIRDVLREQGILDENFNGYYSEEQFIEAHKIASDRMNSFADFTKEYLRRVRGKR